ncbi:hypothetical protein QBC39DRAFT_371634 [Podospora conica]|nr:hypothetical protein QBC39DRAFT_371634 [Schizothecium conicum]
MPSPGSSHLADLSDISIHQLASLLCIPDGQSITRPPPQWVEAQQRTITTMIRESTPLARPLLSPAPALPCRIHNRLNPLLVRRCLGLVQDECSPSSHLRTLVAFLGRFDAAADDVSADKRSAVGLLRREVVPVLDRALAGVGSAACPACVLAVVGGRRDVLCAMEASIRMRRGGHPQTEVARLVEAWMRNLLTVGDPGVEGLRGRPNESSKRRTPTPVIVGVEAVANPKSEAGSRPHIPAIKAGYQAPGSTAGNGKAPSPRYLGSGWQG